MHIWRCFLKFVPIILVFIFFLNSYAMDSLEVDDIEKFKFECWPNPDYNIDLKFAPVRKILEKPREKDQWSYEFTTEDKQYPDKKIKLPKSGAVRVDLVLILNKSESLKGESYLWNVIVCPNVDGWGFGGHWPTKKPLNEFPRLRNKRESLINMGKYSSIGGQPVHTKVHRRDIDSAETLNRAWIDIFGEKIVTDLVYLGTKGAQSGQAGYRGYSLTFYHVPTPTPRLIDDKGYKWPSFKHIDKTGKVYGFVLTPEGECLAWDWIDIVK